MAVTAQNINSLFVSGQWDMLRLTAINECDIVRGKYLVAFHRTRPILIALYMVNVAYLIGGAIPLVSLGLFGPNFLLSYLLTLVTSLVVYAFFFTTCNVRLVLAASLAIALRIKNLVSAAFICLAVILSVNVLALFVLPALITSVIRRVFGLFSGTDLTLFGVIEAASIGIVWYGFYRLSVSVLLNLACNWASKLR